MGLICKALLPDFALVDAEGQTEMSYEQHFASMFETAKMWALSCDADAYCSFLNGLFHCITTPTPAVAAPAPAPAALAALVAPAPPVPAPPLEVAEATLAAPATPAT